MNVTLTAIPENRPNMSIWFDKHQVSLIYYQRDNWNRNQEILAVQKISEINGKLYDSLPLNKSRSSSNVLTNLFKIFF